LVEIFTNRPPPEKPHFTSVIFKSDGGETFGVFSIAVVRPWPKVFEREATGAIAAAMAALVMNDLLESDMSVVLRVMSDFFR
jgi:hypothetical protein